MTQNITTGVTTTNTQMNIQASDLAPNNYLTIIWTMLVKQNILILSQ